jgi:hypothetical protein
VRLVAALGWLAVLAEPGWTAWEREHGHE